MLKEQYLSLSTNFTSNASLQQQFWSEIEKQYTGKKRFYHNLTHLENLITELKAVQHLITDWSAVLLAVFYHDIVYKAHKKDNEEQSAVLAIHHLQQMNCTEAIINKVNAFILATKSHQLSGDADCNLFTDADLSILGKDWEQYFAYSQQVRKEYAIYPDFLYKPGRKKVLQHLLSMERIYKTDAFYHKYETAARQNLSQETELL